MATLVERYRAFSPNEKSRLRRILTFTWLLVLAILAVWLVRNQRQEIEDVWRHLKHADRRWLAIAIAAEAVGIVSVAWTNGLTLTRLGHRVSILYLTGVHLQRTGVNFAAPFGGVATGYAFVERIGRKGVPAEDGLLTLAIRSASVWGATLVVLVVAAGLTRRPLAIAGSVAAMIAVIAIAFWLGRAGSGNWKTPQRWANKLPERYAARTQEAIQRLKEHELSPRDLLGSIGTTLVTRMATITLIFACVRALGEQPSLSTVFFAYVASFVAARIVPVLYGMGAVEGSLSLALTRGGVPLDIAVGAALLFRFFDFLAPSILGLLLYVWEERHS